MKKVNILCLPYAGGSSAIYNKWKRSFGGNICVIPMELAGRGRRMSEAFYEDINQAAEDIYNMALPLIKDEEYVFFGHSMGSMLAYELCRRIVQRNHRQPLHLFVSGRYPPDVFKTNKYLSRMPDDKFKEEIMKLGGTDRQVFENKELCNVFIPILKADYKIIEEYEYVNPNIRFDFGITVFTGRSDEEVTYEDMQEWGKHTLADSKIYEFDGGHFFINDKTAEITEIIKNTIQKLT